MSDLASLKVGDEVIGLFEGEPDYTGVLMFVQDVSGNGDNFVDNTWFDAKGRELMTEEEKRSKWRKPRYIVRPTPETREPALRVAMIEDINGVSADESWSTDRLLQVWTAIKVSMEASRDD